MYGKSPISYINIGSWSRSIHTLAKTYTNHYKKRDKLNHLNCIIKLNDSILNYLCINDSNIHNSVSITVSDVIINLFSINSIK